MNLSIRLPHSFNDYNNNVKFCKIRKTFLAVILLILCVFVVYAIIIGLRSDL